MKTLRSILIVLLLTAGLAARADSIVNSVHNLSASGPGTIKATTEANLCVFCHTVHRSTGDTPLWNHSLSGVTNYIVYSSPRLTALNVTVPQPNGSSRLCLSCHDGTVALGSVNSRTQPITMQNGVTTMPSSSDNLGTDLSSDHPISFTYNSTLYQNDSEIKDPGTLTGVVRLDPQSRVQCTSCHDPHNDKYGSFLVMDNSGSALCLTCHQPESWISSAHGISSAAIPQALMARIAANTRALPGSKTAVNRHATVAAMGCAICHADHNASGQKFLMQSTKAEENCFVCHNGTGSSLQKNVEADFQKASVHPITLNADSHTPNEDPINPPERHVTCADCHNPHAAKNTRAFAPNIPGALAGVVGVSAGGGIIKPAQKEYEVCYRCHADSRDRGEATVVRQFPETNTRYQFATANMSYHPVEAPGKNLTSVPSLIQPYWTVNSTMYCTDCHNSDTGPNAGGTGANGPHGSIFRPLLERNLVLTDHQAESPAAYAMCYKCHSRPVVLSNTSFKFHQSHVVQDQTACTTCHDSHGVPNAPHLINFNALYVTASSNGRLNYTSTGVMHGTCTLTCHGKDHQSTAY